MLNNKLYRLVVRDEVRRRRDVDEQGRVGEPFLALPLPEGCEPPLHYFGDADIDYGDNLGG